MSKTFRSWDVDQSWLLPRSVHEFVPAGHPAHFVRDTVREVLDLSAITRTYDVDRGQPPYHPGMMVALLLYGYSRGVYASRRLAQACEERVDFMAVTGLNRPDFRTISDFRLRHLAAEVEAWLKAAAAQDAADDAAYGAELRGDETPDWMGDKQKRLARIRQAMAELQAEAASDPDDQDPQGPGASSGMQDHGQRKKTADGGPPDKAQRNFTDPDSRIQPTRDGFIAGYNGQIAVDAAHQIIVAQRLATNPADYAALVPLVDQAQANLGRKLREVSGDSGFATEDNLAAMAERKIRAYLPPARSQRNPTQTVSPQVLAKRPRMGAMAATLKRAGHRSRYRLRKQVVEPVFGQIKQARGFRQHLLRGITKVRAEWAMICTVHNLLKLAKATA